MEMAIHLRPRSAWPLREPRRPFRYRPRDARIAPVTGPYATAIIVVSLVLSLWAFAQAALNRLHVSLAGLRRRGLRAALERVDEGYRLPPGLRLASSDARKA